MCQCNFGSSDQPTKKSLRDQYPEKFTEEYISDRAVTLADKLCNCDPYNIYSFNNVFTKDYEELLKEIMALPDGFNEDQLAPVPYIISKDIPQQTDAAGKLNIKIRVKAGD